MSILNSSYTNHCPLTFSYTHTNRPLEVSCLSGISASTMSQHSSPEGPWDLSISLPWDPVPSLQLLGCFFLAYPKTNLYPFKN